MTIRDEPLNSPVQHQPWADVLAKLTEARHEGGLSGEDLERLALAAYMLGDDRESERGWTEAHHAWLKAGDPARASRCAFWQALGLFFRGDLAPATGWVVRGGRLLDESRVDCAERAWFVMLTALPSLFSGDAETAASPFQQAAEVAARFGDTDAEVFARLGRGYALILQGQLPAGMALLDEVMVAVTAGEVTPLLSGILYCQVIVLCQAAFDVRRASEWTDALTRWCDDQPGLVPFRGNCLVHRCEIFQLRGEWVEALDAVQDACQRLAGPPAWDMLGSAYYQLGEIQRLRDEFAEAETSYHQARFAGRDPEPGMSLLWLAQGRLDLALPASRRALDEETDPLVRCRLLPAAVEILLAGGDLAAARAAAEELSASAAGMRSPYLDALASQAQGAVLLAEGDPPSALIHLRTAQRLWRDLRAPHPAACGRAMIGAACAALGDGASAQLEFDTAERMFRELGATPDLERLQQMRTAIRPGSPLSPREAEVLALVANGKSNAAIAADLVISEKTVARHMSNIFSKLAVSSRCEATAWAYRHGMMR